MEDEISRRTLLSAGAAGVMAPTAAAEQGTPCAELAPLTSRSGVFTPPRGDAVMHFSFDFPEPSLTVGALQIAFRIHTFENAYAVDARRARVTREGANVRFACDGLLGAG